MPHIINDSFEIIANAIRSRKSHLKKAIMASHSVFGEAEPKRAFQTKVPDPFDLDLPQFFNKTLEDRIQVFENWILHEVCVQFLRDNFD